MAIKKPGAAGFFIASACVNQENTTAETQGTQRRIHWKWHIYFVGAGLPANWPIIEIAFAGKPAPTLYANRIIQGALN